MKPDERRSYQIVEADVSKASKNDSNLPMTKVTGAFIPISSARSILSSKISR